MAHPGYACLLHCPQPRPILVVIAESSHRSNLVGAVRFVCRKLVVTRAEARRVLVVRADELVHGAAVTCEAARLHVAEIILHKAVVKRAADRAIPFRCEEAFVEKFVWMAVRACDLGNTPSRRAHCTNHRSTSRRTSFCNE